MKKILNVKLKRNPISPNPNDFNASVVTCGNIDLSDIIDKLVKDDQEINREMALKIINAFNRKTADLVLSGYNVNTNLVNLSPTVKGSFYGGHFKHELNSVDVSIHCGSELNSALLKNNFQIIESESEDTNVSSEQPEQRFNSTENDSKNEHKSEYKSSLLNPEREPACGMAFRRWLCNS